ncbi:hypothetical protein GOODEAATRI_030869 [Goodea atripinnis]|uniref:Uncharacterized protein n=1 Tax=Goodea atripinnis TaxID=208336 RepID=A0ABV0MM50_9TELE
MTDWAMLQALLSSSEANKSFLGSVFETIGLLGNPQWFHLPLLIKNVPVHFSIQLSFSYKTSATTKCCKIGCTKISPPVNFKIPASIFVLPIIFGLLSIVL